MQIVPVIWRDHHGQFSTFHSSVCNVQNVQNVQNDSLVAGSSAPASAALVKAPFASTTGFAVWKETSAGFAQWLAAR